MPKYFLYARKSTDEDSGKQIHSIEDQIALVTEYCQREGIEIEKVFTESQTAKIPGRPVFDQMLRELEEKGVTGIVSWHPDRLARNSVDGGKIIYLLDQGIIRFLKFPTFWFENTTQGRFMLSLAFSQAKYYVDSLSENVTRGMNQKAKRGEFPGMAPPGYINDRNSRKVIINAKTSPVIKQALILFSQRKLDLTQMKKFLCSRGVTTRSGKKFWQSQVHRIVTSPFYYGAFFWKGELYQGIHEPLISKPVFDQNQKILKQIPNGKYPRGLKDFIFKGLIRCSECGHPLTAEDHTKHYKNGTSQTFTYYHCTKADKRIRCGQKYISQSELIKQVNKYVSGFVWPQRKIDRALAFISAQKQKELKDQVGQINSCQNQIRELDQQINQLIDLRLKGIINDEELLAKKNELTAKKLNLKGKNTHNSYQPVSSFEPVEIVFKNLAVAKKIRDDDGNLLKKAQFLQMTASNLTLKDKNLQITPRKTWAALGAAATVRNFVSRLGFEPRTNCLRGNCSTIELPAHLKGDLF